jgi:hypothetical protein
MTACPALTTNTSAAATAAECLCVLLPSRGQSAPLQAPRSVRRATERITTARVCAFPLRVHRNFLREFTLGMAKAGPNGAARDYLIWILGAEWDRLEDLGVDCDEIEQHVHHLARELWSRAFRNTNNSPGAA